MKPDRLALSTVFLSLPLAYALSALVAMPSAQAADLYWDVNGATAGFSSVVGFWNNTNNFWNTNSAGGAGTLSAITTSADDLFISQATTNNGNITLSGATKNASSITFLADVGPTASLTSTGTIIIGGTGAFSGIRQQSSGANSIASALQLNSGNTAFEFYNSGTGLLTIGAGGVTGTATSGNVTQTLSIGSSSSGGITIGGAIADVSGSATTVALTVNNTSTGITTLIGANTYTGGTTISAGTLSVGSGSTSGSIVGDVANSGMLTFNRTNGSTYAGAVSGTGAVTKSGTNTLTLTGANTYTGGTTINAGTLSVGNGSTTGSIVGDVTNNSNLTFFRSDASTYGGVVSGTGAVTKSGAGTLTLTGANSYDGTTTISAGSLNIQHATGLGTTAGGTTVANNAALALQGGITVGAEALTLRGTGVSSTGALLNVSGDNTYGGAITRSADTTIGSTAGTLTLSGTMGGNFATTFTGAGNITSSGAISGTETVTKSGAGTLTLSGANTYTGTTTINGGVLAVTNGAAIADTGTVTLADVSGATLTVQNSETIGSLQGGGATGGNVTIAGGQTLTVAETGSQTFAGIISDAGGLTKTGAGTLALSGANTYSGATTVSAGTLELSGASGALSATTEVIINGGTLLLSGSAADRINDAASITMGGAADSILQLSDAVTETMGALTLTGGVGKRVIDFGATSGVLTFASLSSDSPGLPLEIWNWSGNIVDGGGTDRIVIASGILGGSLSPSDIQFYSDSGVTAYPETGFTAGGELVPVPEATPLLGVLGLMAPLAWRERRHWMRCQVARG